MAILVVIAVLAAVIITRSKYRNKSNAGAFFFENDSLILNSAIPYAIPFDKIDRVELRFNSWELEHKLSYGLFIKVVKTDGKTKRVFYKGYGTAKLARPADMENALKERGIRCVMVDR